MLGHRLVAAQLDDRDPGGHFADRHQYERGRPRGGGDVMGDAEAGHIRAQAVADGEREHHPRPDARDQQRGGKPSHAGDRQAVLAGADVGCETGRDAEGEPDGGQQADQDEVVAGGRNRVQVHLGDEEDEDERDDDAAAVKLALPGLARHDQQEHCVDEVIGDRHGAIIFRRAGCVVGARVEPRVEPHVNPRVDSQRQGGERYQETDRRPDHLRHRGAPAAPGTRRADTGTTRSPAGRSARWAVADSSSPGRFRSRSSLLERLATQAGLIFNNPTAERPTSRTIRHAAGSDDPRAILSAEGSGRCCRHYPRHSQSRSRRSPTALPVQAVTASAWPLWRWGRSALEVPVATARLLPEPRATDRGA